MINDLKVCSYSEEIKHAKVDFGDSKRVRNEGLQSHEHEKERGEKGGKEEGRDGGREGGREGERKEGRKGVGEREGENLREICTILCLMSCWTSRLSRDWFCNSSRLLSRFLKLKIKTILCY